MDVPLGTQIRCINMGEGVIIRHAMTDEQRPYPGAEEEAAEFQKAFTHVTDKELEMITQELRENLSRVREDE